MIGLSIGIGWLVPRGSLRELFAHAWRLRWLLLLCVFAANTPDLDFLPGIAVGNLNAFHQTYTHSIAFAALMALLLLPLVRSVSRRRAGWWLFAVVSSHLLADLFSVDTRPPIGIMAVWPFSSRCFISPVSLFQPLRKAEWADILQWHNVQAVLIESAWCLPLLLGVLLWKTRLPAARDPASTPAGLR